MEGLSCEVKRCEQKQIKGGERVLLQVGRTPTGQGRTGNLAVHIYVGRDNNRNEEQPSAGGRPVAFTSPPSQREQREGRRVAKKPQRPLDVRLTATDTSHYTYLKPCPQPNPYLARRQMNSITRKIRTIGPSDWTKWRPSMPCLEQHRSRDHLFWPAVPLSEHETKDLAGASGARAAPLLYGRKSPTKSQGS